MSSNVKILGISGSLRRASFNTALLHAAQKLAGDAVTIEAATLHGIPLYDGDLEQQGMPSAVDELKAKIAACDGLLLVTPEYNNGIPGVFKNAIDWLSRPSNVGGKIFANLPVAIIGASPGGFGTILAQNAWLPVLKTLGTQHWSAGRLMASRAGSLFNENGELTDEAIRSQLEVFVHGFAQFARGK